jgi:hypothetical protein
MNYQDKAFLRPAMQEQPTGLLGRELVAQAAPFIARQSMLGLASSDDSGVPWASLLFGRPGFIHTNDGTSVTLDIGQRERDLVDPLWENIEANAELAVLLAEPGGGRRYRIQGTVGRLDARSLEITVHAARSEETHDVQPRALGKLGEPNLPVQAAQGTVLRGAVEHIVRGADTFIAAGRHLRFGIDTACRSGAPGLLLPIDAQTLRIADDGEDCLARLLCSLEADGQAGICIPDFEHGQLLQLSGTVRAMQGYWTFHLLRWILRDAPKAMRWDHLRDT